MKITVGWLYYDLMNTYGDRGNVLILKHRAKLRNIQLDILNLSIQSSYKEIQSCDFLIMGGAEDRQQEIVIANLVKQKKQVLKEKIQSGTPSLFICGAYQFLGQYYRTAEGKELNCLGLLPFHTIHPGQQSKRLIGEIVVKITNQNLLSTPLLKSPSARLLIGFENHGGRTYFNDKNQALGTVLKGYGNNERDQLEGFVFQNTIGTYLHGPILARSPSLADFFLAKALELKYNQAITLDPGENNLEQTNQKYLLKQLHVRTN